MHKAHQRIIREQKKHSDTGGLFAYPVADIKKAKCKQITYEQAKKIILEYEWLGTMGTCVKYCYGIFFDDVLAGAICFGDMGLIVCNGYGLYVGEKYKKKGLILNRGACTWWAHEHSASKLISFGLSEISKKGYKFCVAFSDPLAGEIGTVYQATNWYYLGFKNDIHYDIYYKESGKIYMGDRDFFTKYGFRGKFKIDEWLKDKPHLERKTRLSKGRYIKLLGNKQENKEMMIYLRDKIKQYPKRKHDNRQP